ncbi:MULTISPECIES: acyl-CoA dehydrogenase family protein [Streptomyces]|uniref:Acyl-CoA dehydrogenase n=1 Tax=Streptomyces tsukubensis (strain DSM 42081 / NBRC 108919 / NRRL 18488 / 9993) TaxID=1114943 RepID=I2NBR8_STRT9|nr:MULTISPECIES: acyl-CoA dehydrogenase family protein [Streptomyces]AZK92539.1 acyl-CoA dehydrogenase [Streptomyces tsukubensis]EIF94465.1 methoxymalonate biosynthesis protein [Streptomyces tsukubensis NRRL18488]MYS64994.1 acyl-CoA dehydrogenase [Streptomyces sp. SID5473]QKM65911.1 acyl-CoA dehydrogenase [Streptomyces tsukubensis NRRL18488]TAI40944.1 acyl-CoA dehydrogenase [Streptomyces tsukubensis]
MTPATAATAGAGIDTAAIDALVGDGPAAWDAAGRIPVALLRKLGAAGVLCAEVPAALGGPGADPLANGELTAHIGALCSSLRSIMTVHGIAAATVHRFGDRAQRRDYLGQLTSGRLACVGFSEPGAGSDLSGMTTRIRPAGDSSGDLLVTGEKMWITGAVYADTVLVFGQYGAGPAGSGGAVGAAAMVPADAPGVSIEPVKDPLGCRAATHCRIVLDDVRIPASAVLGGGGQPLSLLFTTALSYGRMSVAWGCAGILRACLTAATADARTREQGGVPIAEHQLVARHIAELYTSEQIATQACRHAAQQWTRGAPDAAVAAVLAKQVAATHAARGAATAVQVLASRGFTDGHVTARAYRDAKAMELIEGSTEISQLILARHALDIH